MRPHLKDWSLEPEIRWVRFNPAAHGFSNVRKLRKEYKSGKHTDRALATSTTLLAMYYWPKYLASWTYYDLIMVLANVEYHSATWRAYTICMVADDKRHVISMERYYANMEADHTCPTMTRIG
jgi:hypothetical protein